MRCLRWAIAVTMALTWGLGSAEPADAQVWIRVDGTWMRSPGAEPRQWVRHDGSRYNRDGYDDREDRYDAWYDDREDRYDAWYDDREDRYDHWEAGWEARDDREDAWEAGWEARDDREDAWEDEWEAREQWYQERDERYEHSHEYRECGRDGRWEDGYATSRGRRPALRSSLVSRVRVPPGHRPPPGLCRVWFPGAPPGRQRAPEACEPLFWYGVPPGAVVVGPAVEGGPPPGPPGRGRGRGPRR